VEPVPDEGVFLMSEAGHKVLTGRLFQLVAPLVSGTRSPEDIVDCLEGELSAAEVYYALSILEKKGYLTEAHTVDPMSGFWTLNGIDPREAHERLSSLPVSVEALGTVDANPFISVLKTNGIQVAEHGDLGVVLTDDYLREGLAEYNEEALKNNRPWMLIKPFGVEIFIGPFFVPNTSGCWRCLKHRYIRNRGGDRLIMDKIGREDPVPRPPAHTPATLQVAYNMAATEIAKWIAEGGNKQIEGGILSVDTRTWRTKHHTLTRLARCPSCGKATGTACGPSPVILREGKAAIPRDGGYRTAPPEETLKKFGHLVSPITGIVSSLKRDESLAEVLHVYSAGYNFAQRSESLAFLRKSLRNAGGKGGSEVQAKASGICEAIERCSWLFQGYEPRIASSLIQLGERAIHPNECMLFSQNQFQMRDQINAKDSKFNFVPVPFDNESVEIEWSPVWSLTHETFKYLPTQYLYVGYRYPDGKREPAYFPADSNGNAFGTSLEEAVLQGFFELVERDCVALWWYNMLKKPAVDLASFQEPYFAELANYYRKENREIWVLDITSDLGIPAFAAVSRRCDIAKEHIIAGFGCHLDAKLAVKRALTEMNQFLSNVHHAFLNGNSVNPDFGDHEAINFWESATCENLPYLSPDREVPLVRFEDHPKSSAGDLREHIQACRKIVEDRGMEMLVLDQTRPDIGGNVVKVIVPGLRNWLSRLAPGRLYNVPVQMGWLQKPLKEDEVNRIGMPF